MRVCFETFGCRLNRAEALQEEAVYLARGWERTERHDDADLIVVRGCSVTRRAERDSERLIAHIREKYPFKRVIVTGCLASAQKNYFVNGVSSRQAREGEVDETVPTRTARAYLKVQDGCNGFCTFCIVPRFRGKARSVGFDACVARARRFIDAGYREIVVTGCNLSMYASEGRDLAELLAALADLSPDCRIRLGSLEPTPEALKVVETVASRANICNYLHIPVQSGSDRVLAAMRRPYQVRLVEKIVHEAGKLMPDLGLGCDLMTGFPGETDTEFLATKELFRRLPFTKAHVFPYSERPDTAAATMPRPVDAAVRSARAKELAALSDAVRTRYASGFVGRTVEIVVEDEATLSGWTAEYLWCVAGGGGAGGATDGSGRRIARKDRLKVLVRRAHGHVLVGTPV